MQPENGITTCTHAMVALGAQLNEAHMFAGAGQAII